MRRAQSSPTVAMSKKTAIGNPVASDPERRAVRSPAHSSTVATVPSATAQKTRFATATVTSRWQDLQTVTTDVPDCRAREAWHRTCKTIPEAAVACLVLQQINHGGLNMSVAKTIEISAESADGFDAAIKSGIEKAGTTVENIQSAWIKDQVVLTENGKISGYRVHMNVTFLLK
jgi:flavin-binding protein dodecin